MGKASTSGQEFILLMGKASINGQEWILWMGKASTNGQEWILLMGKASMNGCSMNFQFVFHWQVAMGSASPVHDE